MPTLAIPQVKTEAEYFAFSGGLDQTTPALKVPGGRLMACQNYEPDVSGGYRRVGGYERYDGRTRPSDATYQAIACTLTVVPAAGDALTIGAATCWFVEAITGGMVVTNVVGSISASTAVMNGVVNAGTTAAAVGTGTVAAVDDATYTADASDVYRTLIQKPPGSGPVRGVVYYSGALYCFRDNAGATAAAMWKSSGTGWTAVTFTDQVAFSNADANVKVGDTLTQGGVTATILRIALETGAVLGGVNTGHLVISVPAGGNFAAGAATTSSAGTLTLSGAEAAIALSAGGTYRFDIYNFGGQQASTKLYGCNGIDHAFEFDGTTLTPLNTGAATDAPIFIKGHRRFLYVAQGSSVMNSSIGDPTRWVAAEGASEIAVGDTITGLATLPGEALAIACRNSSFTLTGASPSTWSLDVIRADMGAVAGTLVSMSDTFMLDDRGITSVRTAQTYGNFQAATLSQRVQPTINLIRGTVVCAYPVRQKNQYVLLCSDGTGLVMSLDAGRYGGNTLDGFTTLLFSFVPHCVWSGEDSTGMERVWVGAADGYVYELNVGSSFDGAVITAFMKVWFNHSNSPRVRKRYRLAVLEMVATTYAALQFLPDFSYGDTDVAQHLSETVTQFGTGGTWDLSFWNLFTWDSPDVAQPRLPIEGTGTNLSLFFYSSTRIDQGHVLQGAVVHFTPRRIQR